MNFRWLNNVTLNAILSLYYSGSGYISDIKSCMTCDGGAGGDYIK